MAGSVRRVQPGSAEPLPSENVLRGIYVGSVTQGITDCRGGTQYLNGYESVFGYRDFLREQLPRRRIFAA